MKWRTTLLTVTVSQVLWLGSTVQGAAQNQSHVTVDVIAINGDEFLVQDQSGTQATIRVGSDTEKYGHFQPGDRIEAWVYPDGHAKTIVIVTSASVVQEGQHEPQHAQR
jgi:hypothetical protein